MSPADNTSTEQTKTLTKEEIDTVKKQVEFYLSDENVTRDKFLLSKLQETEEGWVDISVLATFRKLSAITRDVASIASAVSTSDTLILSDDKTKIRRKAPLPNPKDIDARTVFCKNLPTDATFEDLTKEFEKLGKIGALRMKRNHDGSFTGCVFVVYKNKKVADKLLKKKNTEILGNAIQCMTVEDYNTIEKPSYKKSNEQKRQEREEQIKADIEKRKQEIENERENYPRGCVLRFSGLKDVENLTFIALKDYFAHFGEVAHISYEKGATEGICRFKTAASCERAVKELDAARASSSAESTFLVAGCVPSVNVLSGDAERAHWNDICDQRLRPLLNPLSYVARGRGRGRGRGRRGRGRGGKRGGDFERDDDREPAEIETVVEDN